MEDFTKPFKQELSTTTVVTTVPNEFGGIYDKPKQRKKSFIDSRKNKDNFWNLMFAVGFIIGMGLVFITAPKAPAPWPIYSSIIFWTTLLGVPLVVRHFSKITFIDGKFLNKEGIKLDIPKQLPNGFFLVATTIGTAILIGAISDKLAKSHPMIVDFIFAPIFLILFFFIPVLFFIFKNCPISILFNYQFYKQNARSSKKNGMHWTQDPLQYYVAGNIYYNNHNSYHLNKHK
jgi:hypothetical protein